MIIFTVVNLLHKESKKIQSYWEVNTEKSVIIYS